MSANFNRAGYMAFVCFICKETCEYSRERRCDWCNQVSFCASCARGGEDWDACSKACHRSLEDDRDAA